MSNRETYLVAPIATRAGVCAVDDRFGTLMLT